MYAWNNIFKKQTNKKLYFEIRDPESFIFWSKFVYLGDCFRAFQTKISSSANHGDFLLSLPSTHHCKNDFYDPGLRLTIFILYSNLVWVSPDNHIEPILLSNHRHFYPIQDSGGNKKPRPYHFFPCNFYKRRI